MSASRSNHDNIVEMEEDPQSIETFLQNYLRSKKKHAHEIAQAIAHEMTLDDIISMHGASDEDSRWDEYGLGEELHKDLTQEALDNYHQHEGKIMLNYIFRGGVS